MRAHEAVDLGLDRAHPARIYAYWLGGKDHFKVDRDAGDALTEALPSLRVAVRANRAFMIRVVTHLAAERGIRQFLDIGAGLPVAPNLHEVAQAIAPASRVVYLDNDRCKPGCVHIDRSTSKRGGRMHADLEVCPRGVYCGLPEVLVLQRVEATGAPRLSPRTRREGRRDQGVE